jgi:quercetin dioxygenase-like cupin family protein
MKRIDLKKSDWTKRFTYERIVCFDKLLPENTVFQIIRFKPFTSLKPHYHNESMEIYLPLQGKGELEINRFLTPLTPNNTYFIEKGDVHAIYNDNKEDLVIAIFKPYRKLDDIIWGEK